MAHAEQYLRDAQRELAALTARCAGLTSSGGVPDAPDDVLDVLSALRRTVEARMARVVFNGGDLRDDAADELDRLMAWLGTGVTAACADRAAQVEASAGGYHAAACAQLRAWQAAVDVAALEVLRRRAGGEVGAGESARDLLVALDQPLGELRRRLRFGLGPGPLRATRADLESGFDTVRATWVRLAGRAVGGERSRARLRP